MRRAAGVLCPLLLFSLIPSSSAAGPSHGPSQEIKHCILSAARESGLDPVLLAAIAKVESSFNPRAININRNGSADRGLMQVNDIWLPVLRKAGIEERDLFDPCVSARVGAWILSGNIRTKGWRWEAIGSYNSGNPSIGLGYARKVYAAYDALAAEGGWR